MCKYLHQICESFPIWCEVVILHYTQAAASRGQEYKIIMHDCVLCRTERLWFQMRCVCVYAGFRLICKMNSIFDLLNLRNLNQIIYTPQHCRPTILLTEIVQITCKTAIHSNMQIMIDLRLYQVKCVARKYFMDTWPWFVACVPCYVLHYCDLWTLLLYIFLSEETWLWWR